MTKHVIALAAALAAVGSGAWAQDSAADGIAKFREMLADGNPAELFEAKGEALWTQKRGPKNASLEKCDLGLGPGVVKVLLFNCPSTLQTPSVCKTWKHAPHHVYGNAARLQCGRDKQNPFWPRRTDQPDGAGNVDQR
jgi:hypothetical protein